MGRTDKLRQAKTLAVCWRHEIKQNEERNGELIDPLWSAILKEFNKTEKDTKPYARGFTEFAAELLNYKLVQEDRGRRRLLHPRTRDRLLGEYVYIKNGHQDICLFRSNLRLNTDGPTMPVLRMLSELIKEVEPGLVLSIGFGGATRGEVGPGTVYISSSATFKLQNEFAGSRVDGETLIHNSWVPDRRLKKRLSSVTPTPPPLLPLQAPSPHYDKDTEKRILPKQKDPKIEYANGKVETSPLLTDHAFVVYPPSTTSTGVIATDMDAAAVAWACQRRSKIKWAAIVGIVVPALHKFENDFQSILRKAWRDYYFSQSAQATASNLAKVVHIISDSFSSKKPTRSSPASSRKQKRS
jgi:hypothetical protein